MSLLDNFCFKHDLIKRLLLGTSKGLIFETEIVLEGDKFFTTSLEQYFRQVCNISFFYASHKLLIYK